MGQQKYPLDFYKAFILLETSNLTAKKTKEVLDLKFPFLIVALTTIQCLSIGKLNTVLIYCQKSNRNTMCKFVQSISNQDLH